MKVGDVEVSRNPATGKTEAKRVVRTTVRRVASVLTIHLADGKTGREVEAITATGNHPFYVAGAGFVEAERLGIGCQIVTRAGPALVVQAIEWKARREGYLVYNFEVADDHTYFVGQANGGAWVHNPTTPCPDLSSLEQALEVISRGDVRVSTRGEAEEIARAFAGYKNTTGEVRREAELLSRLNQNSGYYHWADEVVVENGIPRVVGHSATDPHGVYRHLQIHTFGGKTVRAFYGPPVR